VRARKVVEAETAKQFIKRAVPHIKTVVLPYPTLRREVGSMHVIRVSIFRCKHASPYIRGFENDCYLRIYARDRGHVGGLVTLCYESSFASVGDLANTLKYWRNLYGAPLDLDGKSIGKVEYFNPELGELIHREYGNAPQI
jgi:hypothetical protein